MIGLLRPGVGPGLGEARIKEEGCMLSHQDDLPVLARLVQDRLRPELQQGRAEEAVVVGIIGDQGTD